MALAPKPVAITSVSAPAATEPQPEPLGLVGTLPAGAFAATTLTAVPALADTAAVKAYLDVLVPQLKSSPYFN